MTDKQNNCPYCHVPFYDLETEGVDDKSNLKFDADTNHWEIITYHEDLEDIDEGFGYHDSIPVYTLIEVLISYCPICGRNLEENK